MQIVIEVSEDYYEMLKYDVKHGNDYRPIVLIANGTPLPKEHGRLIDIDAVWNEYPNKPFIECITETPTIIEADKGDKE